MVRRWIAGAAIAAVLAPGGAAAAAEQTDTWTGAIQDVDAVEPLGLCAAASRDVLLNVAELVASSDHDTFTLTGPVTGRIVLDVTFTDPCADLSPDPDCVYDLHVEVALLGGEGTYAPDYDILSDSTGNRVNLDGTLTSESEQQAHEGCWDEGQLDYLEEGTFDGEGTWSAWNDGSDRIVLRFSFSGGDSLPTEIHLTRDHDDTPAADGSSTTVDGGTVDTRGDGGSEDDGSLLIAAGLILALLSGGAVLPGLLRNRRTPPPIPEMPPLPPLPDGVVVEGPDVSDVSNVELLRDLARDAWLDPPPPPLPPAPPADPPVDAPDLDDELTRQKQLDQEHERASFEDATTALPLADRFAAEVARRAEEGYFVRNPTLLRKIWHNFFLNPSFWRAGGGQCSEFAERGVTWVQDFVRQQYGEGAIVDEIGVKKPAEHRVASEVNVGAGDHVLNFFAPNHRATRVTLPDGQRLVLDFWEHLGRSGDAPPRLVPEDEWVDKWRREIGNGHVARNEHEEALHNFVRQFGDEKGIELFRRQSPELPPAQVETMIRAWQRSEW